MTLGLVFLLIGLLPTAAAIYLFSKNRAIKRWPKAPGKILHSKVVTEDVMAKNNSGHYETYKSHWADIRFRYTVDGIEHESNKVARTVASTNLHKKVAAVVDRYPVGAHVEVMVNPADPAEGYLETSFHIGALILSIFGGIWTVIGLAIVTSMLLG